MKIRERPTPDHPMPGLDGLGPVFLAAEDELGFSWTRCDACNVTLGGNRYLAWGWRATPDGESIGVHRERGEWVELHVCDYCHEKI